MTPKLDPGLYIVATPIGNLGDITLRAVETLRACDMVACEDTRVAGRLLHHLGLKKRLVRHDDHADERQRTELIAAMGTQAVVLVSDAGTPLVSDPGYRLVRAAREAGIMITSLPGPVAAIVALTLAGLPTDRFLFAGFLPPKAKARGDALAALARTEATLVFYETAPRLTDCLTAIGDVLGQRPMAVARELTKLHEECRTGTPAELADHYRAHPPRGEIVLVIGPGESEAEEIDLDALLIEGLAHEKPSQLAARLAREHGLDRKAIYARALELR